MSEEYANYNYKMPISKTKQTSVEFLFELLPTIVQRDLKHKFEQAKAMHKKEVKDAWLSAWKDSMLDPLEDKYYEPEAEQYYNKEYGKNINDNTNL